MDNEVRSLRTRKRGRRSGPSYPSMFGGLRRYLEHYLAHPATFLHEVEGGSCIFEGERLVDFGTQAVFGVEVEHRAELFWGTHRRSQHVEVLEPYTDRHRLRRRAGRRADDHDPAPRPGE